MKKSVRIICLLLSLALLFCCCSCESKAEENTEEPKTEEKQVEQKEEQTEKITVDFEKKNKVALADIKDSILINGRCAFDDTGLVCTWSNSGFEISGWFYGAVNIYYVAYGENIHLHAVADTDDTTDRFITLSDSMQFFTAANFQTAGYHTVSVYKSDEVRKNKYWLTAVEYKGKIDEEGPEKTMKIEFIGDSISCGVGLNAPSGLETDAFYAYTSMLARSLKAQSSVVAIPGWALSRAADGGTENLIPNIYDEYSSTSGNTDKWDFVNNQVDVVCINLGTNDYMAYYEKEKWTRTELYDNMNAFLDKVRACYPDAYIYWTYGMMNTIFEEEMQKLIEDRGDGKLKYVYVSANTSGVGSHPDYEGHLEYEKIFEGAIRKDLKPKSKLDEIKENITKKNMMLAK